MNKLGVTPCTLRVPTIILRLGLPPTANTITVAAPKTLY